MEYLKNSIVLSCSEYEAVVWSSFDPIILGLKINKTILF